MNAVTDRRVVDHGVGALMALASHRRKSVYWEQLGAIRARRRATARVWQLQGPSLGHRQAAIDGGDQ